MSKSPTSRTPFFAKAEEYSLGTTHLVHQGFVSSHWSGIGTSLFSENSMNAITPRQLAGLMDDLLDTESFHEICRNLTRQPKKVPAFGLMLDNPKVHDPQRVTPKPIIKASDF